MVDPKGHVFWTVILYTWQYACIPLAFSIDRKLRARWLLEDVSRPASGYRFKGANMRMVVTSRVEKDDGQSLQHQTHGRSRWLECTNLWWLAVVGPGVFIFAAELSSGVVSVLLLCTPFVCLTLFSLSLNQVCKVCVCVCIVAVCRCIPLHGACSNWSGLGGRWSAIATRRSRTQMEKNLVGKTRMPDY